MSSRFWRHFSGGMSYRTPSAGKHPFRSPTGGEWRHDAHSPDLVRAGVTDFGTEVYYPEVVLDAELRILVGEIRPHYFAGYSGRCEDVVSWHGRC